MLNDYVSEREAGQTAAAVAHLLAEAHQGQVSGNRLPGLRQLHQKCDMQRTASRTSRPTTGCVDDPEAATPGSNASIYRKEETEYVERLLLSHSCHWVAGQLESPY